MENQVFVVRCADYDQLEVRLDSLLSSMGGMGQFVSSGEKLVLKVNLLLAARPEQAVTTHPALVAGVGKLVKSAGASALIADSPGSGFAYNERTMERVYRNTGMAWAAEEAGIDLNMDCSHRSVACEAGQLVKRLDVITPVLEADGVINLCKMKTHTFMGMTGGVKNNFGVIPGLNKPGYHAKLREPAHFAGMLLDLSEFISPRLTIMDAVVGMEGNGPNSGTPRQVGYLLASRNPLALDIVAGEMMGLPRQHNPVLLAAEARGMAPTRMDQVDLVGADLLELKISDYRMPDTFEAGTGFEGVLSMMEPLFKNGFTVRPSILTDDCVACGTCRDACPVQAISMVDKKYAVIDENSCIRCYCCHEMCPHDAIELRPGFLYRLFHRQGQATAS
jgi:uncharacterized protein (DUF362 family)/NAD-dependent dihydropyrimidine dehydrogenase PreA subunit